MRVITKYTVSMITGVVLECEWHEYQGPVALACGATDGQKDIANQQKDFFSVLQSQSAGIFGAGKKVFDDLMASMSPIVAAGPGQEGFTPAQMAGAKSQIMTETGAVNANASRVAAEKVAALGGGNIALPSGLGAGVELESAQEGAQRTSSELLSAEQESRALGYKKWLAASDALSRAPSAFDPAIGMAHAATSSGNAAAESQDQIAKENQSWVQGVTGALGGIAGSVVTGGMSNLGKGEGFFG